MMPNLRQLNFITPAGVKRLSRMNRLYHALERGGKNKRAMRKLAKRKQKAFTGVWYCEAWFRDFPAVLAHIKNQAVIVGAE